MYKYLLKLLLVFFLVSCSIDTPSVSIAHTTKLAALLETLNVHISSEESLRLSTEIFQEVASLRKKFQPVAEPHINNFLINVGLKEKGLCYQWSDALYHHFKHKNYKYFEFHLLVANKGEYFFEHNVFVVVAKKGSVMQGVIIDPWRDSKNVYFSKIKEDKAYQWEQRKEREIL